MSPGSSFIARILFLNVCTKRSAWPFVAAWYAADLRWVIPLLFMKLAKVLFTNCGPLSETIWLQRPLRAKTHLITLMVFSVVVDFIIKTSGHFECASIMTKNILFMNEPKKSICTRSHGEVGHSHGCKNAFAGSFCCFWQPLHCFTRFSMSLSIPGQNT